jgi:Tol biopolymer transport system component
VLTVVSKEPGVTHVAFARLDGRVSVTPVLGTAAAEIGHDILIYVGPDGGLMASRIDERARRMIPGAIALGETPSHVPGAILTSWNASRSGTLAYANAFATNQVMYVDRSGAAVPAIDELASFRRVRVSPDGTRLALEKFDGDADIWLYTIPSRTLTRLTTTGRNSDPLWTADGKRIAFTTSLEGVRGRFIASRAADGSGVMDTIVGNDASLASKYAASWSHDGGAIVFEEFTGVVPARLSMMRAGERPTVVVSSGDGPRRMGAVSPDGHWIAYVAGDEGVTDVYVSPFPGPGGRYQVSDHGGSQPVWAHNGRELFYRDRASVVAATVATAADFHVTDRKALFKDSYLNSNVLQWDVMPDDRHFVMIRPDEAGVQMTVVTNWLRELNAKLPPR